MCLSPEALQRKNDPFRSNPCAPHRRQLGTHRRPRCSWRCCCSPPLCMRNSRRSTTSSSGCGRISIGSTSAGRTSSPTGGTRPRSLYV